MCEKKNKKKNQKKPKSKTSTFEWCGCLAELRDKYTSVELQHRAMQLCLEAKN